MNRNILNTKKYMGVLDQLIALNRHGVNILTNKINICSEMSCSEVEYLESFKDDVDKTASYLEKVQPIIYSAKNGLVVEYESLDNSIESVFAETYNKEDQTITLCGVKFELTNKIFYKKIELREIILDTVFGLDSKMLTKSVKQLSLFEDEKDLVKQALLYPSIKFAKTLISKVADQEKKFNDFRSTKSLKEKVKFNTTFNRSGITDVIQTSSYVSLEGIQQQSKSHYTYELIEISVFLKTSKYFEAIEIDQDGDPIKALRAMKQMERFRLNLNEKITFKFRKLGNHNVTGMCIPYANIVAEDIRNTSALLHEFAHQIHINHLLLNGFVNYMIEKMSARLDFDNVSETLKLGLSDSKMKYYSDPKEILARTCEIAALFAQEKGKLIASDNEFILIKSREYYEEDEGIYFNFTQLNDNDKEELSNLYTLFYETSPDDIVNSNIDNFSKIDTNYVREEKELSISDILKKERKRLKNEKKALFSAVTAENIKEIVDNKSDEVSLEDLITTIFANYSYLGGHKDRMTLSDWLTTLEDKAGVLVYLMDKFLNNPTMGMREKIQFLEDIKSKHIWKQISYLFSLNGFADQFRMLLKEKIKETNTPNMDNFKFYDDVMKNGPVKLLPTDILKDTDFIKSLIVNNKFVVKQINESNIDIERLKLYQNIVYKQYDGENLGVMTHETLLSDSNFARELIVRDISYSSYIDTKFFDDKEFFKLYMDLGGYFHCIGESLADDKEFVISYLDDDNKNFGHISKRLKEDIDILKLVGKYKEPEPVKKEETKKPANNTYEKNEEYEKMIEEADIVDFEHTQTGKKLKVIKLKEFIGCTKFKNFHLYLRNNGIAYYSKIAGGFIIKNTKLVKAA